MEKESKPKEYYRKGYLVLKRKPGQGFHIDENTEVVIMRASEGAVFVAIRAPGRNVLRNEILQNEPRKKEAPDHTRHTSVEASARDNSDT